MGAAHVGRFRRPSLSLLAHQQVLHGVQGRCKGYRSSVDKTGQNQRAWPSVADKFMSSTPW
ncbi:MAG: hypothetical protein VX151_05650 [Candidatus Thermoplasmatota archaeon]|nr:hypothetical protein [Candidatus Thermoplasmatota archaeon]